MADLSSYVNRTVEGGVDADVETWLGTPTAANLRTALSPEGTSGGNAFSLSGYAGQGGSGGTDGDAYGGIYGGDSTGGGYGGGGGGRYDEGALSAGESDGFQGAVRVLWGPGRAFPDTNVGAT
jgi:hypothetical protein